MEKVKRYYFRLKFWPDKEHRKIPSDACLLQDEPNIYEMLKYRNEVRLWYLNWFDVWETYSWLTTYYVPLLIPAIWIITGNWILGVSLIILYVYCKRFIIGKYKNMLWGMKFLVPGFIDPKLEPHFGPQLPFVSEENIPGLESEVRRQQ